MCRDPCAPALALRPTAWHGLMQAASPVLTHSAGSADWPAGRRKRSSQLSHRIDDARAHCELRRAHVRDVRDAAGPGRSCCASAEHLGNAFALQRCRYGEEAVLGESCGNAIAQEARAALGRCELRTLKRSANDRRRTGHVITLIAERAGAHAPFPVPPFARWMASMHSMTPSASTREDGAAAGARSACRSSSRSWSKRRRGTRGRAR